jgi:hypothetical protein
MSDQHTHTTTSTPYDDPDLEWDYEADPGEDETGEPPKRPRRKLLTPVSGGLAAIALVAGGFIAGVQVQKGQESGGGGGGARAGAFPGAGGGAGLAGRGQSGGGSGTAGAGAGNAAGGGGTASNASSATVGTVANVKGSTLYVTGTDGTTVKIRTNDNSTVTRNADASVSSVHPGDTVVIQGAKNDNGTVTATSITATAKGVSAFGGLGFGGAGTQQGGGTSGGTTGGGTTGGTTSGVPQGFAPPQG